MNFADNFTKYELPAFGMVRLPEVKVTDEQKTRIGLSPEATNKEFLLELARHGFKEKLAKLDKSLHKAYSDRINYEIEMLEELGFIDYCTLIWLIVDKFRSMGGFVDFGRGSCAGSLLFYLIGVTNVDPIHKNLFFERFVSKTRSKKQVINGVTYLQGDLIADVDLNIGGFRNEIVEWLKNEYQGKISKILAIGTLTGKILIKDVYKTLEEVSEEEAKRVSDMIEKHFGVVEDIEKMPEKSDEFKKWAQTHERTFQIALKLRDIIRQKSSHASGYLLSFYELDGFIPYELNKDKEITSSYDMNDVSNFAIKVDLLGLISNEIIKDILSNIPEKLEDMNLDDDPLIYDQFKTGNLLPYGLYQISADVGYRVVNAIKPKNIFELSDVNAIARPGALAYLDDYVNNANQPPHEIFSEVLAPTRNLALYQEQLMKMSIAIGFTADEAEILRRIVGKKKLEEVKKWKSRIYDKIAERKLPENIGDILWKILDDSANYSFNLSHSVATAYLSALTVYLKYKYPIQFYLACLKSCSNLPAPLEEISGIQKELHHFGIKLLPPDITIGNFDFRIEGNNIRFGLSSIKGIAGSTVEKFKQFQFTSKSKCSFFESAKAAKLSIAVVSALIQSGCCPSFNTTRSRLVLEAQAYNILTDKEKRLVKTLEDSGQNDILMAIKTLSEMKDEKGKEHIKASRFETFKKKYLPFKKIYYLNSQNETFASWFYERTLLGFSYSTSLRRVFQNDVHDLISVEETKQLLDKDQCKVALYIEDAIASKSRKGSKYIKLMCADETGNLFSMMFEHTYEQCEDKNQRLPTKADVIIAKLQKSGDAFFVQDIWIQTDKIYMKASELKKEEKKSEETT